MCISVFFVIYKLYYVSNSNTSLKYVYEKLQDKNKEGKSKNIQKLELLQKINKDIVALIEIAETNINYPVVQTEDNSYYLMYDYKKEESKDGALMLDKDCNLENPTTNILIYGHNNIGSNKMFSDLIKYKKRSFYENHKTIKFTTNSEDSIYEIICVFLSKVYYKSQTDVFKYYFFKGAKNVEEFNNFITNCKILSIYDIDNTAVFGDQLMTLSTCEYSTSNGRLVVVAKKIK